MSDQEETSATIHRWPVMVGIVGLIFAGIALFGSVLSPWITKAIDPPEPIEEVATDMVANITKRLASKIKGENPQQRATDQFRRGDIVPITVISIAAISIVLGVACISGGGNWRLGGAAVGVGASAIIFLYFLIIAAALLLILLVFVILSALGIDL